MDWTLIGIVGTALFFAACIMTELDPKWIGVAMGIVISVGIIVCAYHAGWFD